jgi:hypothetical protein
MSDYTVSQPGADGDPLRTEGANTYLRPFSRFL